MHRCRCAPHRWFKIFTDAGVGDAEAYRMLTGLFRALHPELRA